MKTLSLRNFASGFAIFAVFSWSYDFTAKYAKDFAKSAKTNAKFRKEKVVSFETDLLHYKALRHKSSAEIATVQVLTEPGAVATGYNQPECRLQDWLHI
jgi:hypothetical protein